MHEEVKAGDISLLGIIIDREKQEKMMEHLQGKRMFFSLVSLGRGTANSRILGYFGLGQTEKAVMFTIMPTPIAHTVLEKMNDKLEFSKPGHGVAFLAPLYEGCYHRLVQLREHDNGGNKMNGEAKNDVIMVVLNRGYTEEVMDAARSAGATGGTVLHARGCGLEGAEKFFGVTIQPEKEMILILADAAQSCGIMQAIADVHGPGTDAGAVSFSMPASHAMGIGNDMAGTAKK